MNKFDNKLYKYRWVAAPLIYSILMIMIYLNSVVVYNGVELPQNTSGLIGIMFWNVLFLIALIFAWILHWIVELGSRIFGKIKKN